MLHLGSNILNCQMYASVCQICIPWNSALQWIFQFTNGIFLLYALASHPSFFVLIIAWSFHIPLDFFQFFIFMSPIRGWASIFPIHWFYSRHRTDPWTWGKTSKRALHWSAFEGKVSIICALSSVFSFSSVIVLLGQFVCFLSLLLFLSISGFGWFAPVHVKTCFKIMMSRSLHFPWLHCWGCEERSSPLSTVYLPLLSLSLSPRWSWPLFPQSHYVCNWIAVEPF